MQNQIEIYQQIIAKQAEITALIEQLQALNPELAPTLKKPSKRFEIPSIQEITDHIKTMGYAVSAVQFHAFYSSKGWMIGKNKMKCWKSALVTWDKKQKEDNRCFNQAGNPANFFDSMNSQDF